MRKTVKKLTSPAGIALWSALITVAVPIGYDLLKGKPVFSTIWSILKAIWSFIIAFLNFELRVWWILIGLTVLFCALYIIVKINDVKNTGNNEPPFLRYTKDYLMEWKWEWYWEKGYDGKYSIKQLHPICPHCGTPLVQSYAFNMGIACPRCNYKATANMPDPDHIKVLITDNAKRKIENQGDNL